MFKKNIRIKYFTCLTILFVGFAAYKLYNDVFTANVNSTDGKPVYIFIRTGKSFDFLLNDLDKNKLIFNVDGFRRLAKLMKLDLNLKPGKYKLDAGMNNQQIIRKLKSGTQETINLIFNHAERKSELPSIFSKHLELDTNYFSILINDTAIFNEYGFDSSNIISLFLPNTYNMYWNTSSSQLFHRMKKEYDKFWNKERLTKAYLIHLSPQQVSTLASIVEKETNKLSEMPLIARVYLNRIDRNMPLQADPTLIFALNDNSIHRVLLAHTEILSPYNTYLNLGLPPGPICSASIQAIDAVLNAAKHNYIYFCAKEDFSGYHVFAETLKLHNQNAKRYQKELNKRKIY